MNIIELYLGIWEIAMDNDYPGDDSSIYELLLCAEAQGWVKVGEPDEVIYLGYEIVRWKDGVNLP